VVATLDKGEDNKKKRKEGMHSTGRNANRKKKDRKGKKGGRVELLERREQQVNR